MGLYLVSDTDLKAIARKIREKTGRGEEELLEFTSEFISEIEKLTYTGDANATAADILSGKTAYVNKQKLQGTIPSLSATTYKPSTTARTLTAGTYLAGNQVINSVTTGVSHHIKTVSVSSQVTGAVSATGHVSFTTSASLNLGSSYANKKIIIWGVNATKGNKSSSDYSFASIHFNSSLPMSVTADSNGIITFGTYYIFGNSSTGQSTLDIYYTIED